MKKIIASLLSVTLLLVGCSSSYNEQNTTTAISTGETNDSVVASSESSTDDENTISSETEIQILDVDLDLTNYSDPEVLSYVEDSLYLDLVDDLSVSETDYLIEEVRVGYVSQEYIDELSYNSQPNVYFGYTLEEIDQCFQGERYVFTLGDNGQTEIETYEAYDGAYEKILRNVAIGSGVIVVCVVVAVATGGAALPAECATISLIFTSAAEGAAIGALTSGAISGGVAGAIEGFQSGDMNKALRAGLVSASEGFASGAILGGVTNGVAQGLQIMNIARSYPSQYFSATQLARWQKNSKIPPSVLAKIETVQEYEVLSSAGLKASEVGTRLSLIRDIDLEYVSPQSVTSKFPNGRTNLELMQAGRAPFDPLTDTRYELHHIGQQMKSPLAILTRCEHEQIPNLINESQIARDVFDLERARFWKDFSLIVGA